MIDKILEFFKNLWYDFTHSLSWKYSRFICWWNDINVWRDQQIVRGYSDKNIWGLHVHLTEFILPRLKAFKKEANHGFPACLNSEEEWHEILDKMILAFELMWKDDNAEWDYDIDDPNWSELNKRDCENIVEGLKLFAEYYQGLWD